MELEETFCILQPCYVYKLPPRSSTQGFKAADWDLDHPVWKGRITFKVNGEKGIIRLEDEVSGEVFAVCNVHVDNQSEAVEPVLDSSRYYVLKLEDEKTKRHAFIGMGFHERDQSFEFKAALQDHKRRITNERKLVNEPRKELPKLNLTLKEGEQITVDLKTGSNFQRSDDTDDGDSDDFLPPPPKGNKKISPMSLKNPRTATSSAAPLLVTETPASTPTTSTAPSNTSDPYGLLSAPVPVHLNVTPTLTGYPSPFSSPSVPSRPSQPTIQPSPLQATPLQPSTLVPQANPQFQQQFQQQQFQQQQQQFQQQQQQQFQQQQQYQAGQLNKVPLNQLSPQQIAQMKQQPPQPQQQQQQAPPKPKDDDPFSSLAAFMGRS